MTHRARYRDLDITLIDAPIADGQSFPGGSLVFTTALLKEPDEATVAGVVAHELAHLDLGHLYEYARRGKLAEATYGRPPGMGADFDQFFTRQMALFGLLMNPFRPEDEHAADCASTTWLYLDGYDPKGSRRLLRADAPTPARPAREPLLQLRPVPSLHARPPLRHVLARLDQLQRWRPRHDLGLYAENLQKRESRFRARADEAKADKGK